MARGFKDGGHIEKRGSYSIGIRISPIFIKAMNWWEYRSKKDILEVIPIPEKGILILKGASISTSEFESNFKAEFLKNNSKIKLIKIVRKLKSLIRKFQPLDIIVYQKRYNGLLNLLNEQEKHINKVDDWLTDQHRIIDDLIEKEDSPMSAGMMQLTTLGLTKSKNYKKSKIKPSKKLKELVKEKAGIEFAMKSPTKRLREIKKEIRELSLQSH